jgi:hypothetical protein
MVGTVELARVSTYSSIELTNPRDVVQVSSQGCCGVQLQQLHCCGGRRRTPYSSIELTNPRKNMQASSPRVRVFEYAAAAVAGLHICDCQAVYDVQQ